MCGEFKCYDIDGWECYCLFVIVIDIDGDGFKDIILG